MRGKARDWCGISFSFCFGNCTLVSNSQQSLRIQAFRSFTVSRTSGIVGPFSATPHPQPSPSRGEGSQVIEMPCIATEPRIATKFREEYSRKGVQSHKAPEVPRNIPIRSPMGYFRLRQNQSRVYASGTSPQFDDRIAYQFVKINKNATAQRYA